MGTKRGASPTLSGMEDENKKQNVGPEFVDQKEESSKGSTTGTGIATESKTGEHLDPAKVNG